MTKRKKILFICQLPPPLHGASAINNQILSSEDVQRNFIIDLIDLKFARSLSDLRRFSLEKVLKTFGYGFKIFSKLITDKFDFVYLTLSPYGFAFYRDAFFVFIIKAFKRKLVFHLHGKGIKDNSGKNLFNKYLYRFVFKDVNVICLSEKLTADIADVYKEVPFIIPNGIQIQSKSKGIYNKYDSDIPTILFLSNYKIDKGILILIEALNILNKRGVKFNARLVGASSDLTEHALENIIQEEYLDEFVKVTGPLYGESKNTEFTKADIFVHPSLNDAFPLVILEAMHFSLPVISTTEGGIPDIIIDGYTGYLVEPGNAQVISEKIDILLRNKELRIKMGERGFNRFMNLYTMQQFEKNIVQTFQVI